jgi:hypothetical protein
MLIFFYLQYQMENYNIFTALVDKLSHTSEIEVHKE